MSSSADEYDDEGKLAPLVGSSSESTESVPDVF